MKIDRFDSEKSFFTDESVKRQITDSISENLTDSDLESRKSENRFFFAFFNSITIQKVNAKVLNHLDEK